MSEYRLTSGDTAGADGGGLEGVVGRSSPVIVALERADTDRGGSKGSSRSGVPACEPEVAPGGKGSFRGLGDLSRSSVALALATRSAR